MEYVIIAILVALLVEQIIVAELRQREHSLDREMAQREHVLDKEVQGTHHREQVDALMGHVNRLINSTMAKHLPEKAYSAVVEAQTVLTVEDNINMHEVVKGVLSAPHAPSAPREPLMDELQPKRKREPRETADAVFPGTV